MQIGLNVSELVKDGEKTALFDSVGFKNRREELTKYRDNWRNLWEWLKDTEYGACKEWAEAIAKGGSPALMKLVHDRVDADAKKAGVSVTTAKQWKRAAVEDISQENMATADAFARLISSSSAAAPLVWGKDGPDFDIEKAVEEQRQEFVRPITDEEMKISEELKNIGARLREIELMGYNALELVKKYTGSQEAPFYGDDLAVLVDITTRQHNPGFFALDEAFAYAIAAKKVEDLMKAK